MTKEDVVVLLRAFKRMEKVDSNGIWIRKTKSASEINVSDDIFNILVGIVEHHNRIRNHITKSSSDIPTDCVLQSLAFLGDYSWAEINFFINSYCGGVVTIYNIDNILHHFYPNYVTYSPDSLGGGENFSKYTTVGYFFTGGTGSQHMVNINGIIALPDSSVVSYYDAQNKFDSFEYLNNFGVIYKLKP